MKAEPEDKHEHDLVVLWDGFDNVRLVMCNDYDCDYDFDRELCDWDIEVFNGYGYGYCPLHVDRIEGDESSNFFLSIITSILDFF